MNTNKFFSFNRCWLLLRNDVMINHKKYLLTILGAFIVGYVILYLNMPKEIGNYVYDPENNFGREFLFYHGRYENIFITLLMALGAFIGLAFPLLGNKVTASNFLLIPATTLEKFVVEFLIRIVAGLSIFMILFWLDAHLARITALSVFEGDTTHAIEVFQYSKFMGYANWTDKATIMTILLLIGIYLFSIRIFFKKHALLKTIISIPIIISSVLIIMVVCTHIFFPQTVNGFHINWGNNYIPFKSLKIDNFEMWILSITCLSWVFLLPLGYYKLKEKEL